jgi:ribosomal protein L40E
MQPHRQEEEPQSKRGKARSRLLSIGVVLSTIAVVFGCSAMAGVLVTLLTNHDFTAFYSLVWLPPGLFALVLGGIGLAVCLRRLPREVHVPADLPPPEQSTIPLEAFQARVAAGLCPKCGSQVAPAAQNCPSCGINLAWAKEHLDELARSGRATTPDGSVHK